MPEQDHILLAEDDSGDAFLTHVALKTAGISNPVHIVASRAELLSYLDGEGPYANRNEYPLPTIVILALRLPMMHGFDVLRWIRARPKFNGIHVSILSGMEFPDEERVARELGADTYDVKPSDFSQLVKIADRLRDQWLRRDSPFESFQQAA